MIPNKKQPSSQDWEKSNAEIFWGEIAPCDHLVQIYENDDEILEALENFVDAGFRANESVIIIATKGHVKTLNEKLKKRGHDLEALKSENHYIPLDAEDTLSKFMVVGWPDEALFTKTINGILALAQGPDNRKVRAYGEMVAILWGQGYNGATVQLEHLWNKLCEKSGEFSLFCAYPKSGFTRDIHQSIDHICSMHSKVISGNNSAAQIYKAS